MNKLLSFRIIIVFLFLATGIGEVWGDNTGTIVFGPNATKVTSANTTVEDNLGYTWSLVTEGTTYYNNAATSLQLGSSNYPASSIKLSMDMTDNQLINTFSATFGGFANTVGTIILKVDGIEAGRGNINGTSDVTVSIERPTEGRVLSIEVSGISKGVRLCNISYSGNMEDKSGNVKESRTVTIEQPENGSLSVMNGETEIHSGDNVLEGTTLTISTTPNDGYRLRNWQAVDETTHTYTVGDSYTVGTSNVIFKANFDLIPRYTVKWNVNGKVIKSEENVIEGSAVEAPEVEVPQGVDKVFVGWTTTPILYSEDAPTYVYPMSAQSDAEYFAVFAAKDGESSTNTVHLDLSEVTGTSGYKSGNVTDKSGGTWNYYASLDNRSVNEITVRCLTISSGLAGGMSYIESPVFPANVVEVSFIAYNGDKSNSKKISFCSTLQENQPSNGDLGNVDISSNELFSNRYVVDLSENGKNKFYIYASASLGLADIKVVYGAVAKYSDFTTLPDVGTVTIASACTDGKDCYSTYSSGKAFVVPEEMNVYEVAIVDGAIKRTQYQTGDVVGANTGVMVSAANGGDYTIHFTDADATNLGAANNLHPTYSGITKEQMGSVNDGNMYYRLTMHNGATIGFWWGAEDGGPFAVVANKAYLVVPAAVGAKSGFTFTDVATGIDGSMVVAPVSSSAMYNLSGQRIVSPSKGIFIVNGKKFVKQ